MFTQRPNYFFHLDDNPHASSHWRSQCQMINYEGFFSTYRFIGYEFRVRHSPRASPPGRVIPDIRGSETIGTNKNEQFYVSLLEYMSYLC